MEPERRLSVRTDVRLDAALREPRAGITHGKIRNMNLDGVFVELDPVVTPLSDRLEIVLFLPFRRELRQIQLPAVLLRTASEGVALKFDGYSLSTYKALVRLLYSR